MSMSSRMMTGTPPFKERNMSRHQSPYMPGPSNSPTPYPPGGHQDFTPTKMNSKSSGGLKAPKAPEKPLMPYMRYSRKVWDSVKAQNAELKLWQIGKIIGQMWRDLSDSERKEYNDAYELDKGQYQEKLKIYHNSPAYQNYLKEKQRSEQLMEEEERRAKAGKADHRVNVLPSEYDSEADAGLSIRHLASVRYQRNHTLINQIFNETCVPDPRSVIMESRLNNLRKQVDAIQMHQTKIEKDIDEVTEKYEAKKRKFTENNEEFAKKLKEICDEKPVVSHEKFTEMIEENKRELKLKYDKIREQLQAKAQQVAEAERAKMASQPEPQAQSQLPIPAQIEPQAYQEQTNTTTQTGSTTGQMETSVNEATSGNKEEEDVMNKSTDPEDEGEESIVIETINKSEISSQPKPDSTNTDDSQPMDLPDSSSLPFDAGSKPEETN